MNPVEIEREVNAAIDAATWVQTFDKNVTQNDPTAEIYESSTPEVRLLVLAFSIEDQGFQPGSQGYMGTASFLQRPLIVKLTREQAERAVQKARG